ncbi:hypothetical protein FOZ61_001943 [Perkinsus olseni]|uniref:Uncharacterized protein n=1 Tax=Perkinsus olseni TaxID=32597 RepID=A0A7J6MLG7_PEROL|nr:hypothetical protein FOZ61_001943 [Perkinsus olseni]KAF4671831.1 hypothetical protein FOL46_009836 [Perkinsus olseni]
MFHKLIATAILAIAAGSSILESITVEPPGTWAQDINGTNPYNVGSKEWLEWELAQMADAFALPTGSPPPELTFPPLEPTSAPPVPTTAPSGGEALRARRSSDGYRPATAGCAGLFIPFILVLF